jgi:hypothetical protein
MKRKNDPNMYAKKDEEGNVALISLYVDDIIITSSACKLVEAIKIHLSQEFEMKYLGELHCCLGIEVWKTLISQSKYTKEILRNFNMTKCKDMSPPLEQNANLYS